MSDADVINGEITSLRAYMKAAEDVLESGYMPDITAMENRIAALCEKVQNAPPETHEQSIQQLTQLVDHINKVEAQMRAFQAARAGTNS